MNDPTRLTAEVERALVQYGIDINYASEKMIDAGHDNFVFVITTHDHTYLLVADDYLMEDKTYTTLAGKQGFSKLSPVKLLKPGIDGDYETMFNQFKMCKVYKTE